MLNDRRGDPLSYASQATDSLQGRSAGQHFAGGFTILAILFGALFLGVGFRQLFEAIRATTRGHRDEALFTSAIGFGIGAVCTIAAFRWGREWYRRPGS